MEKAEGFAALPPSLCFFTSWSTRENFPCSRIRQQRLNLLKFYAKQAEVGGLLNRRKKTKTCHSSVIKRQDVLWIHANNLPCAQLFRWLMVNSMKKWNQAYLPTTNAEKRINKRLRALRFLLTADLSHNETFTINVNQRSNQRLQPLHLKTQYFSKNAYERNFLLNFVRNFVSQNFS